MFMRVNAAFSTYQPNKIDHHCIVLLLLCYCCAKPVCCLRISFSFRQLSEQRIPTRLAWEQFAVYACSAEQKSQNIQNAIRKHDPHGCAIKTFLREKRSTNPVRAPHLISYITHLTSRIMLLYIFALFIEYHERFIAKYCGMFTHVLFTVVCLLLCYHSGVLLTVKSFYCVPCKNCSHFFQATLLVYSVLAKNRQPYSIVTFFSVVLVISML